jgi:hypothetical protein
MNITNAEEGYYNGAKKKKSGPYPKETLTKVLLLPEMWKRNG